VTGFAGRLTIAIAALGLLLTGCGTETYSSHRLQQLIVDRLDQHRGFQVQSVDCPAHAKLAAGVVVRCSATLRGGHVVGLRATQLDNKGSVHLVANELFADNVERAIVFALRERGLRATVTCPEHVPVVRSRTFDCAVRDSNGHRDRAVVTIVDSDGGFRWRLRPRAT
jgi:hypothetical protein